MSEEQSYDELYDKGFEEQDTSVEKSEEDLVEEEVEEESLEQPTEEEESEQEEEALDEEEETDTTEEEDSDSIDETETYSITIGGQEVSLTLEEMKLFAQKGGDYTRKTQDLAKSRADIELMTEKNLSHEDLVMLADIKNGNKEALAKLANNAGIDPLDVEDTSSYVPEVTERNFELEDVISGIRDDSVNGSTIDGWISALPQGVKKVLAEQPAVLKGLHIDTINGVSKDIMPEVIKQLAINPNADFVDMYQAVGNKAVKSKKAEPKEEATRETKKRATIAKTKTTHLNDHQDIWDDDKMFETMKKQLAALK